jgi:uncharacterized membrane protein
MKGVLAMDSFTILVSVLGFYVVAIVALVAVGSRNTELAETARQAIEALAESLKRNFR